MRFFTDDGGRRPNVVWSWRSTAAVASLALVSSLAVGLGAAGGLSVLDRPGITHTAVPPPAESPPPLPLDPGPPPPSNPAEPTEPTPPRDSEPDGSDPAAGPETVEVAEPEPGQVEPEPVPEADATVEEGTWVGVDETWTGSWTAVEGGLDAMSPTWPFGRGESLCSEGRPESFRPTTSGAENGDTPTWDTGYPTQAGYER